MKYIKRILQKWVTPEKKVLGRWNIDYCNKVIDNKIDLSNEDHCGPCGQYILDKTKTITYSTIPIKNAIIPIEPKPSSIIAIKSKNI
jgi:hypothetical protein